MFFIIAGISPKTKIIEEYPRRCTVCGMQRAYQTRIDHYLNIFFIPVMRVKKGEPFTICEVCQRTKNEFRQDQPPYQEETGLRSVRTLVRNISGKSLRRPLARDDRLLEDDIEAS